MGKGSSKGQKTALIDVILQDRKLPKNMRFLQDLPKKRVKLSEKTD